MTDKTEIDPMDAAAQVVQLASSHVIARAVQTVAELGIADHLNDGARTAAELAAVTGTHAPTLHRLMRSMAGAGLFAEDEQGRFSLTPLGSALRTGAPGYARSAARAMGGPLMWRAFGDFRRTLENGEPVMEAPIFTDMSGSPEHAARVNETQMAFAGAEPAAVTKAYDFAGIRSLVDVGGNIGNLLTTILLANPSLRGVVYDLPHVATVARRTVAERGLSDRCDVVGGSFFDSVPTGHDAYMLSHVVHDWPEPKCLTILGNIRRAIPDDGRLLIVEQIIPTGNEPHPSKFIDLILLTTTGGRERTLDEYTALLASAGFRIRRVVPTQMAVSVIEAEPVRRS
ncbi:MAG TPA: methyltransferase [Thermoanaerobaculia bacterium]